MKFVGIDYSMTCPAITVMDPDGVVTHFISPTRKGEGTGRSGFISWIGYPYPSYSSPEERFDLLASWAVGKCLEASGIVIEDYAMGAKGKVFHLGENCGLLKHKLWSAGLSFHTVPPSVLKKHATGKGNADKCAMIEAFVKRTNVDIAAAMGTPSGCGSPVSDLVDSYYLADYALTRKRPS